MNKKKAILLITLTLVLAVIVFVLNNSIATSNKQRESVQAKEVQESEPSLVIGERFYITQINDIYYNPQNYYGKTIEIEGFPIIDPETGYTFVGRYGPGCCVSDVYVCMEYQYGEQISLVEEEDWIKVKGIVKKGYDGDIEYTYIDATSIEKLEVRGNDTVTN